MQDHVPETGRRNDSQQIGENRQGQTQEQKTTPAIKIADHAAANHHDDEQHCGYAGQVPGRDPARSKRGGMGRIKYPQLRLKALGHSGYTAGYQQHLGVRWGNVAWQPAFWIPDRLAVDGVGHNCHHVYHDKEKGSRKLNRRRYETMVFVGHRYQRDISGQPDRPADCRIYENHGLVLRSV